MITSFKGEYNFLSNFVGCPLQIERILYRTSEHAYQAMKTTNEEIRRQIAAMPNPADAKRFARTIVLRDNWEGMKLSVMECSLWYKFHHPIFRQKLLDTGDTLLIEGNTWGDTFWGCVQRGGKWVGHNHLGKLLMHTREKIRQLPPHPLSGHSPYVPWVPSWKK